MNNLVADLNSSEPSIICSAIDALEIQDPEVLKSNIVTLLLNTNVWVRSRAARAMSKWDKTEAIRYFASMLFSNNAVEREVALNHSLFFPFKQIETVLLKYLTVENNTELIRKAGLVFMANPDKTTAFRLYEAQKATNNLRSDLINSILIGVLGTLYQAKLENDPPLLQLKKLENEYNNKKLKIYINHFSQLLESNEKEIRLKAAIKLCNLIKNNIVDVIPIIEKYLKVETDENAINQIKHFLNINEPNEIKTEIKSVTLPEERQKIYSLLTKDNYSKYIDLLLPELKKLDVSEQITIINYIEKYGTEKESDYIIKYLNSSNPDLQQATIDCIFKINPKELQSYLPELIKSNSDQVKLSAIKAFAVFDKPQALALLTQMMNSSKVVQRKNALFCLANLDFASISDILIVSLKKEKNDEIRKELFDILLDNANEEIFCEIYFQYMSASSPEKNELEIFLNKLAKKLSTINENKKTAEDFWHYAEARWDEENNIISQRETYKLEKIQHLLKEDDRKEKIKLIKFTFISHGIGFILTLIIWFCFMSPKALFTIKDDYKSDDIDLTDTKYTENQLQELLPKEPITVKGTVVEVSVEHKQVMLVDYSGKNYLLIFNDKHTIPENGREFSAQVLVEDYENSVFTAQVLNTL